MTVSLDQIVPWGRSCDEYRRMFALTDSDLGGRIVGCADGPAAFNAAMFSAGHHVVSIDPLYRFDVAGIRQRINAVADQMVEHARLHREAFVWTDFASPEELRVVRMAAMAEFLDDYSAGRLEGRYVAAALPRLPFFDATFDLAVCSHYLFTYSEQLSAAEHTEAALEMCRVAREVRVFPLVTMFDGHRSPHVEAVASACRDANRRVEIRGVPYEFQRGGNKMLVVGGMDGPRIA